MKTKEIKTLSVTQQLREIRDNLSNEIKDMDTKELLHYLKKKKTLHPASFWKIWMKK
jgi:hypothetical protein